MMELLCPAGSREALRAAVQNGADAVYMGGSMFNARRFASNFDDAALMDAIDYCHTRGVKVYITLNTLVLDKELRDAARFGAFLCHAGADAAIIQDIGLADILRNQVPELPLHTSTQMGIHSTEGARAAMDLGMERIVLSREVPLNEIKYIHDTLPIGLEAFANGALCMSFSGGCLLSSMAGERSGNRGTCAQPCRKCISTSGKPGKSDFALSLGDLCMMDHLEDMERAGVCSIKLEGRMKRAEYVAVVTSGYRAALDGADSAEIKKHTARMLSMFDRGVSTGYFYGDGAKTGWVAQSGKSNEITVEAARSFEKDSRKQGIDMFLTIKAGERAILKLTCGDVSVEAVGAVAQKAQKPQDRERYISQIKKLGDTAFAAESCAADMDDWAFMPMSEVNALRRDGAEALTDKLCFRRKEYAPAVERIFNQSAEHTNITAIVRTAEQAAAAFAAGAEEVALEPNVYSCAVFEELQRYRAGARLLMSLPPVIISSAEREKIKNIVKSGLLDGAVAGNIGQIELIKELPLKIAGTQMNAFNAHTVNKYLRIGVDRVTLSLELTKPQLRDISGAHTSVSVYGRTQLMQLRHCPIKEREGCKNCGGMAGSLTDEAGREFPLCNIRQADGCLVRMLNCVPTDIIDLYAAIPAPEAIQLCFYDESPEAVAERVTAAIGAREGKKVLPAEGATRGHWNRSVE